MADQRDERLSEELTPDQCIDFAAGLLDGEQRAEVLRLASVSPQSEELLRSVMAQAETARGAAAANAAQGVTEGRRSVRESSTSGLARGFRRFLDSLAGGGRLVPAMAVQQGEEGNVVMVQDSPEGPVMTTQVQVGLSDGMYVEIVSGLIEGDSVIVEYQPVQDQLSGFMRMMVPGGGGMKKP